MQPESAVEHEDLERRRRRTPRSAAESRRYGSHHRRQVERIVDVGPARRGFSTAGKNSRVRAAPVQVVLAGAHVGDGRWSPRPGRKPCFRCRHRRRAGCRCPSADGRRPRRGMRTGRAPSMTVGASRAGMSRADRAIRPSVTAMSCAVSVGAVRRGQRERSRSAGRTMAREFLLRLSDG